MVTSTITPFEIPVPNNPVGVALAVKNLLSIAGVDVGGSSFNPISFVTSIFGGGGSDRNISVGGITNPENISIILQAAGVFGSNRDAAGILGQDAEEISRVGGQIAKQIAFLGFDELAFKISKLGGTLASSFPHAQALLTSDIEYLSSIKSFINELLAQPDFMHRGVTGADIRHEFDLFDIANFQESRRDELLDVNEVVLSQAYYGLSGLLNEQNALAGTPFHVGYQSPDNPNFLKQDSAGNFLTKEFLALQAVPAPETLADILPSSDVEANEVIGIPFPDARLTPITQQQPINITVNVPPQPAPIIQTTLQTPTGFFQQTQTAIPKQKSNWWDRLIKAGQIASGVHTAVTLPFTIRDLFVDSDINSLPIFPPVNEDQLFFDFPVLENNVLPVVFPSQENLSFRLEELSDENISSDLFSSENYQRTASYLLLGLLIAYVLSKKKRK